MRRFAMPAAAIAVAALSGCDRAHVMEPDPEANAAAQATPVVGEPEPTATTTAEATMSRADAEDLFSRLLPGLDHTLAEKLRAPLGSELINAAAVRAALQALDDAPGAERDPELGAVRLALEAMLRVVSINPDADKSSTR